MGKSKIRNKRKKQIKHILLETKVIRCSKKELKQGAIELLKRESHRILNFIKKRKLHSTDSVEYTNLTNNIKYLIQSYNLTAELWGIDTL